MNGDTRTFIRSSLATLGLLDTARRALPPFKRMLRRVTNVFLYTKARVLGRSYAAFYEELMDSRARHGGIFGKTPEAVTGTPDEPRRRFAPQFFLEHGWIASETRLLDYGCGNGAVGINFIKALGVGCYTGADVSSECLRHARRWVASYSLDDKAPEFVHLPSGSLAPLEGRTFDVIYAQDVLVHMPPEDIRSLLRRIPDLLRPSGVFLATFTYADRDCEYQNDFVNWHHNARFFAAAVENTRLTCEEVPEWSGALYKSNPLNRMMRFRIR